jgi:hypothetical protein
MSQFLVLIYGDEQAYDEGGEPFLTEVLAGHSAFGAKHGAAVAGGQALQSERTAATIRPDGAGSFTVTDGPFVESKEALGGYYLIEAADLDAAVAVAQDIPMPFGGVEVRPVMVMS